MDRTIPVLTDGQPRAFRSRWVCRECGETILHEWRLHSVGVGSDQPIDSRKVAAVRCADAPCPCALDGLEVRSRCSRAPGSPHSATPPTHVGRARHDQRGAPPADGGPRVPARGRERRGSGTTPARTSTCVRPPSDVPVAGSVGPGAACRRASQPTYHGTLGGSPAVGRRAATGWPLDRSEP